MCAGTWKGTQKEGEMPNRYLRPAITDSDRWNAVGWEAQSLWTRLLTRVDDQGRMDGRPAVIVGLCYSVWNCLHADGAQTADNVRTLCGALRAARLIDLYETRDGTQVLQLLQWQERVRKPSKWPADGAQPAADFAEPAADGAPPAADFAEPAADGAPPAADFAEPAADGAPTARHPRPTLRSPPPTARHPRPPTSTSTPTPREGSVKHSPSPPPISEEGPKPKQGKPEFQRGMVNRPTPEACSLYAAKIGLPESEVSKFLDYHEARGWTVGRGPMRSWQAALRTWRRHWEEWRGRAGAFVAMNIKRPDPMLADIDRDLLEIERL